MKLFDAVVGEGPHMADRRPPRERLHRGRGRFGTRCTHSHVVGRTAPRRRWVLRVRRSPEAPHAMIAAGRKGTWDGPEGPSSPSPPPPPASSSSGTPKAPALTLFLGHA